MIVVDGSGRVRADDEPLLFADDLGALHGDGVFETILVRAGRARLLDAHLARLATGAERLDLPVPDAAALRRAVGVAEDAWGGDVDGALRIVYSRGRESGREPTCFLTVSEVPARAAAARRDGVRVTVLQRADAPQPWELAGVKALSYARNTAAVRHARRLGFDDALYVTPAGDVLESPRASVVALVDGVLTTPPRTGGVLPGTTQAAVFAEADVPTGEAPLTVADLHRADGVWLLSALTLAARVVAVDGAALRPAALDVLGAVERALLR